GVVRGGGQDVSRLHVGRLDVGRLGIRVGVARHVGRAIGAAVAVTAVAADADADPAARVEAAAVAVAAKAAAVTAAAAAGGLRFSLFGRTPRLLDEAMSSANSDCVATGVPVWAGASAGLRGTRGAREQGRARRSALALGRPPRLQSRQPSRLARLKPGVAAVG